MRRFFSAVIVLMLALSGFFYQVRLAGELPNAREMLPLACGLVFFVAFSMLFAGGRIRVLFARPWMFYALSVLLLAALVVFGRRYRGGIYLPGRINPSELVKLFFVLFAAGFLARTHELHGRLAVRSMAVLAAAFGGLALGIAVLRDFGLIAQLCLTLTAMLFAASWGWGLASFAVVAMAAVMAAMHPVGHLAVRFGVWRDPFSDMTGAGWQTLQGLTALVSGGWWGKGMGMGEVHAVPIVSSDFVYAALAEEVGFAGCLMLLVLWGVFFVMSLHPHVWGQSPELRGQSPASLLAVGLVASLAIQLSLNVAGVLNALPMTGITLPLLSHGGSSIVAVLMMCGLLNAMREGD